MNEFVKAIICSPLYILVMIFCIILIIIYYLYGSKILGIIGEYWTKQELKKLPKDKYIVLNNILIYDNGITHQIDHIVVSSYGIFCIETKQYNGYITGNKYDKKWIRYLNDKKLYYTNPILQNYGHIKSLSSLLHIDENKIFNIVCISSRAKLNIKDDGETVRNYTLNTKILSYKNIVIDDIDKYASLIIENNIIDIKARKEHVNYIKNNIINNEFAKCPKCGGNLILKNGKYGAFKGCSNYPKCKYTEKVN